MKMRPIIAARATVGAMLIAVTVAACTGGSPSSSVPSIFTPQPATQSPSRSGAPVKTPQVGQGTSAAKATPTARASGRVTSTAKATSKPTATATPTVTVTPTATVAPTVTVTPTATVTPTRHRATATPAPTYTPVPVNSQYPSGAPQTGGGGTAGLQDGVLFEIGGAAILAGLGSLGYRRRLRRKHRPDTPDRTSDPPARTGIR